MKMQFDPKVDAVYIELAKGTYNTTRKVSDSILVDEDRKGKILGIEILDASKRLKAHELVNVNIENLPVEIG